VAWAMDCLLLSAARPKCAEQIQRSHSCVQVLASYACNCGGAGGLQELLMPSHVF
jgi:hypothetical protein